LDEILLNLLQKHGYNMINMNFTVGFYIDPPHGEWLLAVLKPNRLIRKRTDANYSIFHLRVFLGLSNP
jgi:hypothetical protein